MDAISYTAARQDEDSHGTQETTYLLENSANSEHLRKSIADLEAGKGIEVRLEDL